MVAGKVGYVYPLILYLRLMFSNTAEYALRAVAALAEDWQQPHPVQRIAERTRMPIDYLSKVMQLLCKAGVVKAQRGRHGGYKLSRAPEQLSLLEVINAVDPIRRINECPLGLPGHGSNLCPLHRRLDNAIRETESAFRETTLGELLQSNGPVRPLCPVEAAKGYVNVVV